MEIMNESNKTIYYYNKDCDSLFKRIIIVVTILYTLIFIFGIFGNIMSFIINTRKSIKHTTMSIYLRFLAVFDTTTLIFFTIYSCFYNFYGFFQVKNILLQKFICTFVPHIFYFTTLGSSWLIVAMTIDRSIHFFYPTKAKILCTKFKSKFTCIFIIIFCFLLFCHYYIRDKNGIFISKFQKNNTWTSFFICKASSKTARFFDSKIMMLTIAVFACIIPSIIILSINIRIIQSLTRADKRRNKVLIRKDKSFKKLNQTTITLVGISLYFVFSSLPYYITHIIFFFKGLLHNKSNADIRILAKLFGPLLISNNALNFYIYCLTGSKFRNEIKILWKEITHRKYNEHVFNRIFQQTTLN